MATAQSTKKANPEKENHPQDTYHKTNRSTCHEVSKKCVCFHSVTKSTPWAFFHSMDSFLWSPEWQDMRQYAGIWVLIY